MDINGQKVTQRGDAIIEQQRLTGHRVAFNVVVENGDSTLRIACSSRAGAAELAAVWNGNVSWFEVEIALK